MRRTRLLLLPLLFVVSLGFPVAETVADSPYKINMHQRAHKEFVTIAAHQPDFPCFPMGEVSSTYNASAHVLAGGIDGDRFLEPLNYHTTIKEWVTFDPTDPSLPTYTGHRTTHMRNYSDSPNAGFSDNIVLRASDGSTLRWHANVHVLTRPSGLDLWVENQRCTTT